MKNLSVSKFSPADLKQLVPHLKTKSFSKHSVLFEADHKIEHALLSCWCGGVPGRYALR
jgi:hypothetical protein